MMNHNQTFAETFAVNGTTAETIFGGDDLAGYYSPRRNKQRNTPAYRKLFSEAVRLLDRATKGTVYPHVIREAMTTSDFPLMFGDILDRAAMAMYQQTPSVWDQFCQRRVVNDFRTARLYDVQGAMATLPVVDQQDGYSLRHVAESKYDITVVKRGARVKYSWEAMINDNLDLLKNAPERFVMAARNTEMKLVTDTFANNTTFFASGNGNVITGNPVLSVTSVQSALTIIAAQRDTDGNPIVIDVPVLVVPPALRVPAMNLANATQLWIGANAQGGVGSGTDQMITQNWMGQLLKVVVNPWLPISDTVRGNTGWYLFAQPGLGRPAIQLAFLRGYESPQIFLKATDAVVAGGGEMGPMFGSYTDDSIDTKVRHCLGAGLFDPKMAYYSNGSGS